MGLSPCTAWVGDRYIGEVISPFRTLPWQKMTAQFQFFQTLPHKKADFVKKSRQNLGYYLRYFLYIHDTWFLMTLLVSLYESLKFAILPLHWLVWAISLYYYVYYYYYYCVYYLLVQLCLVLASHCTVTSFGHNLKSKRLWNLIIRWQISEESSFSCDSVFTFLIFFLSTFDKSFVGREDWVLSTLWRQLSDFRSTPGFTCNSRKTTHQSTPSPPSSNRDRMMMVMMKMRTFFNPIDDDEDGHDENDVPYFPRVRWA